MLACRRDVIFEDWAESFGPEQQAEDNRAKLSFSCRYNAAADNHRIGNARSSSHGGLSRTRVRLPPPAFFYFNLIR
jgi:hypothetical protein